MCVWCCEVCTFTLFPIKRGQMTAAVRTEVRHRKILLGWCQKLSSSLLLVFLICRLGVTTEFLVSVLVFAYIFYRSLPAGVKARGRFVGFKNKKLKHIICGCWPRGRRQDRWTNDRCPHGWIEDEWSVKKALCVLPEGGNTEPTTDTRNPPSS